jgi:hypothetical protein
LHIQYQKIHFKNIIVNKIGVNILPFLILTGLPAKPSVICRHNLMIFKVFSCLDEFMRLWLQRFSCGARLSKWRGVGSKPQKPKKAAVRVVIE